MKKYSFYIFVLVMLLIPFKVKAATFFCEIGNYEVEYDTTGKIVAIYDSNGNKVKKVVSSELKPTSVSECPNSSNAKVILTDGGISLHVKAIVSTFFCQVGRYKVEYDTTGQIIAIYDLNGNKANRQVSSEFAPTNVSECPNSSNASVVSGGKNLLLVTNKDNVKQPTKPNDSVVYDNFDGELTSCGDGLIDNIPTIIPKAVSIGYTLIQIAVPVVLVIFGSLDLFKGIMAQKEDEIKKGQQIFIKRLISAALVFFVFVIVKVVISFASDSSTNEILDCTACFIEGDCD